MDAATLHEPVLVEVWRRSDDEDSDTRALVLSAAAGDHRAWNRLFHRYQGSVVATARSTGLNAADADDVSQSTWLALFQHIYTLRQPERVRGWLVTTARNEALRLLRQRTRQAAGADLTEVAMESPKHGVAEALIVAEEKEAVDIALQALPVRCQRLVRLLVADRSSTYVEVAAELGMPIGSIGPTRARCLALLRRQEAVENLLAS
jgi:RNA polymerase sigma factor (sigma-70 family)